MRGARLRALKGQQYFGLPEASAVRIPPSRDENPLADHSLPVREILDTEQPSTMDRGWPDRGNNCSRSVKPVRLSA
jgi:hypothetical protein